MNDFNTCLKISLDAQQEKFWYQVYKKAFPNMVNCMIGSLTISQTQLMGVDRIIYLDNGLTITIDEKVRTKTYSDIALEYVSNDTTQSPGWMEKDLSIDYLAYAFLETKTAYLFDWRMLKLAWSKNKEVWKQNYFNAHAPNYGYNTISVCVPINVVKQECSNVGVITIDM